MSQKPNQTPNPNNSNWGLTVPGQPATPSEGHAQAYQRVGPIASQKTRKFDNGTCLTFGPDDPVDEFEARHPFANQLALVDKAIRDIRVTRQRYEGVPARTLRNTNCEDQDGVGSGKTALPDPFDNFRNQILDSANLSKVTLDSGTYSQVPSRFASCGTLVSIYSHPNKSDVPGAAHMGNSVDTRFGSGARPGFDTFQQQHIDYDNDKRRRVRLGRQAWLENNEKKENRELRGTVQRSTRHTGYSAGNSQAANANVNINQQTEASINKNRQSLLRQGILTARSSPTQPGLGQNIENQGLSAQSNHILNYPMNIEVNLHPGQELANMLYSEQHCALQSRQAEDNIAQSTRACQLSEVQNVVLQAPVAQNPLGTPLLYSRQMLGVQQISTIQNSSPLQNIMSLQEITQLQNKLAGHDDLGDQDGSQATRRGGNNQDPKRRIRRRRTRGMAQKADIEYGRYMDELNKESRGRGDTILAGDIMSGHARAQVRFNLQPPSPMGLSRGLLQDDDAEYDAEDDEEDVEADEQDAWSNFMTDRFRLQTPAHHLNPAVFDPATSSFVTPVQPGQHLPAVSRSPSASPNISVFETGRQSEPPRTRPTLLSPIDFQGRGTSITPPDITALRQRALNSHAMSTGMQENRIFGELPGKISRDPSPGIGLNRTGSGRRWFEQK